MEREKAINVRKGAQLFADAMEALKLFKILRVASYCLEMDLL
jgi:hypothetical protein